MLAVLILVTLAAGPAVAAPSGLKDPFATANTSSSGPTASSLGLKNPFARAHLQDPFATRAPAGARAQQLKDPWAHPPRQRPRATREAAAPSDLLDPFNTPRPADSGLRDPRVKRPVVQRPRRAPAAR